MEYTRKVLINLRDCFTFLFQATGKWEWNWEMELGHLGVNDAVNRFHKILGPSIDSIPKIPSSVTDYPFYVEAY